VVGEAGGVAEAEVVGINIIIRSIRFFCLKEICSAVTVGQEK
jgi:hypothetical protein